MRLFIAIIGFLNILTSIGQEVDTYTVTPLNDVLFETSGLIWLDGRLITHNDSGGGHYLYEIDTVDGEIIRTVVIANASNTDWEDICFDETYIYIGDIGNNAGTRTDLKIYKISIADYLTTPNDTVYCDTIFFNYSDQTDFEPALYTTNYDAEGLIACNDSLYIFTKNWGNYQTNVYSLSKEPGTYSISIIDNLNPEALITGADYDADKNELLLIGHTLFAKVVYFVKGFSGNNFSEGTAKRAEPGLEGSTQIEGVAAIGNHDFFVSSEDSETGGSFLHRVNFYAFANVPIICFGEEHALIYPNPTADEITIYGYNHTEAILINARGKEVTRTTENSIGMNQLAAGVYVIILLNNRGEIIHSQHVIRK